MAGALQTASATREDPPTEVEFQWAASVHQTMSWMFFVYLWFEALITTTVLLENPQAE